MLNSDTGRGLDSQFSIAIRGFIPRPLNGGGLSGPILLGGQSHLAVGKGTRSELAAIRPNVVSLQCRINPIKSAISITNLERQRKRDSEGENEQRKERNRNRNRKRKRKRKRKEKKMKNEKKRPRA